MLISMPKEGKEKRKNINCKFVSEKIILNLTRISQVKFEIAVWWRKCFLRVGDQNKLNSPMYQRVKKGLRWSGSSVN